MRNRGPFSALRIISLALIFIALILTVMQLVRFSRLRAYLPAGLEMAGVPVGGLDRQQAAQRVLEAYSLPIELYYNEAVIQIRPVDVDFEIDRESMLALADLERTQKPFWQDFWDYLWGRAEAPPPVPLSASFSEERLRAILADVAERYDTPPQAARPVVGTITFEPGQPGVTIDVDASVVLVDKALTSLTARQVDLPLERTAPARPSYRNLEVLLKQTIQASGFDGLASIYLLDLQTAQEMHFAFQSGQDLPVDVDIAYTASSIIKVPIMVSVFRRLSDNPDVETTGWLRDMITLSGNEVADWLMERVVDPGRGPLVVTDDMRAIGLANTFLAGNFTLGSPLLQIIETPANQRTDIDTDPDTYSQTTASDIGMLLLDIYQCAENGGGSLTAVFPGEITQGDCQQMITYLIQNRLPSLLTAGVPEGTQIAHKHGWVSVNGIINTVGDAGIVYTPSGNYVIVVFLHHQEQIIWDTASALIADLSSAVYNYYNVPTQ